MKIARLDAGIVQKLRGFARAFSPGMALLFVMTVFMWRFALTGRRAMIHGDAIWFGLPLFDLRDWVVHGRASALWSDAVFGGHPLFAEGQGAFASPLPMALATLVTPVTSAVYTQNLFSFLCLLMAGVGVLGLGRTLGLGKWSTAFAALAVSFSPLWLDFQNNPVWISSFAWAPWSLWAMEVWLKRPSVRSAVLLALAIANMVLAGYPQAAHGTFVYMAVSLLTVPFDRAFREDWGATWRWRLVTGLVAVVLAVGLAAVQLAPLAELVGLSHRSDGIGISLTTPADYFLRGTLFTFPSDPERTLSYPNVGSLLVCVLASAMPFVRRSPRLLGHLAAGLVLFMLAVGSITPVFRFLYDRDLIPGLHYFRTMFFYAAIGGIGVAVAAGAAVDVLPRWLSDVRRSPPDAARWASFIGLIAVAILWAAMARWLYTPQTPFVQFAVVAGAIVGTVFWAWRGRAALVPVTITALLVVECVSLRIQPFHLYSASLIAEPDTAKAIHALPDGADFKVIDVTDVAGLSFRSSWWPGAVPGFHLALSAINGLAPIMWNLRGMDGALALPLARRTMITSRLAAEISGTVATPPGARLIDMLSVRFISALEPGQAPAIRPFVHPDGAVWILENTAARPRFQVYEKHIAVESPVAALAAIEHADAPVLVIENPPGESHQDEATDGPPGEGPPLTFEVEHAEPTAYRFAVSASRPGWLFLADANYPGWSAALDGRPAPLFSAQVLGKAVAVPPGQHTLAITFRSDSFRRGALISVLSLIVASVAFGSAGPVRRLREAVPPN